MDNLAVAAVFAVLAMIGGVISLVIANKNKKARAEEENKNKTI